MQPSRVLLMVCMLTGSLPTQDWRSYQAWLWTFGDRRLSETFLTTLKDVGITGINREEGASAAAVGQAGLTFYAGHTVGKGTLHLRKKEFQPLWDHYWKDRETRHLVRPQARHPVVAELAADT